MSGLDVAGHIALSPAQILRLKESPVPSLNLRRQLVMAFLSWYQPLNPILDGNDVRILLDPDVKTLTQPDLLLLYAVAYVTSDLVDEYFFQSECFFSKEQAKSAFWNKAMVRFSYEMGRHPLANCR